MVDREIGMSSPSSSGQAREFAALEEQSTPAGHDVARSEPMPQIGFHARVVLGLACLGSALISVAALVVLIRWVITS